MGTLVCHFTRFKTKKYPSCASTSQYEDEKKWNTIDTIVVIAGSDAASIIFRMRSPFCGHSKTENQLEYISSFDTFISSRRPGSLDDATPYSIHGID